MITAREAFAAIRGVGDNIPTHFDGQIVRGYGAAILAHQREKTEQSLQSVAAWGSIAHELLRAFNPEAGRRAAVRVFAVVAIAVATWLVFVAGRLDGTARDVGMALAGAGCVACLRCYAYVKMRVAAIRAETAVIAEAQRLQAGAGANAT